MVCKHAYLNTLLLLHSAFMLSVVKMLLKGEVADHALNSHRNYIVDHGKSWNCVFKFLWEPWWDIKHKLTHSLKLFCERKLMQKNSGFEVIKLFPCSTQLINVTMLTTVGILTLINMINTTSERLKARNYFICLYFSFYQ